MGSALSTAFATGLVVTVDVSTNVAVSAVLEHYFPSYDPSRSVWIQAIEAWAELTLYIIFAGVISRALNGPLYSVGVPELPYAALFGPWNLDSAVLKMRALRTKLLDGGNNSTDTGERGGDV